MPQIDDSSRRNPRTDNRLERLLRERYHVQLGHTQLAFLRQQLDGLTKEEWALLEHAKIPTIGWSPLRIDSFVMRMAQCDVQAPAANPFPSSFQALSVADECSRSEGGGLGEREGRILCPAVAARHRHMAHGIGRSGDLGEWQPKAAGSSLLYRLAERLCRNFLVDVLKWPTHCHDPSSLHSSSHASHPLHSAATKLGVALLPVCTGMSIFFAIRTLFSLAEDKEDDGESKMSGDLTCRTCSKQRAVVWLRADQKSALKAIDLLLDTDLVIIEPSVVEDGLRTDIGHVERCLRALLASHHTVVVLSTTTCFAPRQPDDIAAIGALIRQLNQQSKQAHYYHVVNNAYGLQSATINAAITKCLRRGLVDLLCHSTDKNLLVPVGGSIVVGRDDRLTLRLKAQWPGRASMGPVLDVLMTLLHVGRSQWTTLLEDRERAFGYLQQTLQDHNIPHATSAGISFALPMGSAGSGSQRLTGPQLFARGFSGVRTVEGEGSLKVRSHWLWTGAAFISRNALPGWPSHCSHTDQKAGQFAAPYMTVATALGVQRWEVDGFVTTWQK